MQSAINKKEAGKIAAAKAAVDCIEDKMLVGLGTGSTAFYFIDALGVRIREEGLKINAVATSERSRNLATIAKIPLIDIDIVTELEMTVDGADEIDDQKRMIKGGGGALLREKILASISREMVVIIDTSKMVKYLGRFPLPIEISPFASKAIIKKIHSCGFQGDLRTDSQGNLYFTDNGNYIMDIQLNYPCNDPKSVHLMLKEIPGVIETGLFLNLAGRVFVGDSNGNIEIIR